MTSPAAGDPTPSPPTGATAEAPPAPSQPNRLPPVHREYRGDAIAVQWDAVRCIHSARCVRAAPRVFDPRRRPWIELAGADADVVAAAVLACPTGALHFTRLDDGAQEAAPAETTVEVVRDGPLYLRGDLSVALDVGAEVRHDTRVALCRCGRSAHMPFCDNTHRAIGFRDPEPASPPATPPSA